MADRYVIASATPGGDPGLPTSGLVARWSASDLALSDGDPVSTWAPGAGSPGSLAGSGASRPTYRATGSQAGGPCVEFDGSDDLLSLESPAGLPDGAAAGTIVAIVSRCPAGSGTYSHIVQYGAAAGDQARGLAYHGDTWRTVELGSGLTGEASSPRTAGGAVLGHAYDGTARYLWLDGVPIASGAAALTTGTTRITVGRNLTGDYGGERGAFRLTTLAIYSTALTDAQWAQVMAHARAAHGVR